MLNVSYVGLQEKKDRGCRYATESTLLIELEVRELSAEELQMILGKFAEFDLLT